MSDFPFLPLGITAGMNVPVILVLWQQAFSKYQLLITLVEPFYTLMMFKQYRVHIAKGQI